VLWTAQHSPTPRCARAPTYNTRTRTYKPRGMENQFHGGAG
jgi:hypothetical protein